MMNSPASRVAAVLGLVLASALTFLTPAPAEAQHRARLAGSLQKRLAQKAPAIDVIVEAPQAEVDRLARTYGLRVKRRLGMGAVLSGNSAQVQQAASDANVAALAADEVVFSTMAVTTVTTGANLLWNNGRSGRHFDGLTGAGVGVAVLDSGIARHADVARRLRLSLDFTGEGTTEDLYGHGTHVAGIIAGSGAGSRTADGSRHVGMAPGAELLSLRVLSGDGTGRVSDVIAAIEWAIENRARHRIRVLNLSLGHATTSDYRDDPLGQAVERAVRAGLVVVASAGNFGQTEDGVPVVGAVVSPGFTPSALTVGAVDTRGTTVRSDDEVAFYSSRGPVGDPDAPETWIIKPDVVAPGHAIVAPGAENSYLWTNYPSRRVIGESGGTYLVLSGSSMATAVVSGAVAQLIQAQPKLTPAEVKFVLQFTAQRLDGFGLIEQGAGSVNVPLAASLVARRYVFDAPVTTEIAGEPVDAGQIVFGNTIIWGNRGGGVGGNTIIWGNRGGGVGGNTIIWGNRGGGVGGNTIIWGNRGGGVGGNTIIWGNRGGGVGGNTIIWGNRGGGVGGNTIIWGNRGGGVGGNTIIWGNRGDGVGGNTIIWGNRDGSPDGSTLWGNTIIWGNRGDLGGNSIIWGNRGVTGNTIIWGNREGVISGNTIIWGNRKP